MCALIAPFGYTAEAMLAKHLTRERIGFDSLNVTFSTILAVNSLALIGSIFYFSKVGGFTTYLFWAGLAGGFFDSVGIVCCSKAYSLGPCGLVSAIITSINLFLTIIEAIKHQRDLSFWEKVGLSLGLYGALVLAVPKFFEKYCFCLCLKKKPKKS